MFLPFIPQAWYDKTNIFWIQSTIIWCWLFFINFVIWLDPYIGSWWHVREQSLITNIRYCFLNALLGRSRIEIKFVHSCKINIFQAKNSKTSKDYLEKYIAHFPWLVVMNIPNCFGEFGIISNNDEFSRLYSGLKNLPHIQVSVHPHEISSHYIPISTK